MSSITIGRTDSSGAITIVNPVTFNVPVTIQAPVGNGSITANGTITGLSDITLALVPSINLTDTRYRDISNSQILAMGASKFVEQSPLPGVPLELATITKEPWQGKSFLNETFTLANLKSQRKKEPAGIIHLATHGQFQP